MTRENAIRRVRLLRAVTVERGATENEARVAASKAAALEARFGSVLVERDERPAAQVARDPWPEDIRAWRPQGGAWSFDMSTGQASANVKVHSYTNRANWRIEVPFP